MASVGTAVFEAVGKFGGLIGEANKASSALDEVSKSASKVEGSIPADGGRAVKGLSAISQRAVDLAKEMKDRGENIGSVLADSIGKPLIKGVKVVGAAAGAGLGYALMKGFQRLSAIEEAQAKLRGLGHSVKEVQKIMDNALKSVLNTKFSLDEAASVAASIVASGIKPGKQLERVLKLVADSAQIAGTSMGEMGLIWSKVAASNKVQAEIINQLTAAGIPIVQMLGKTFHKTSAEIMEMSKKGTITFDMFAKAMEQKLGGSATAAGDTTMGAFENMKIAAARFGAALLTGVFPIARDVFNAVRKWLDETTKKAKPWGDAMAKGIRDFVAEWKAGTGPGGAFRDVVEGIWDRAKRLWEIIDENVIPALQKMWDWAKKVWDALEPWHPLLGKIGDVLLGFLVYVMVFGKLEKAIGGAYIALKALAILAASNPFLLLLAALATLVTVVVTNWDKIKAKIEEVLDWIPKHADEIGPMIVDSIRGWYRKVSAAIGGLWELLTTGSWTQQLQDAFGWKADAPEVVSVQKWRTALRTAFGSIATYIKDEALPMLGRAASEKASELWNWIAEVGPNTIKALGVEYEKVVVWLTQTLPDKIGGAVSTLGPKLWEWIQRESPQIATKLGQWAGSIASWLASEGIPAIAEAGGRMFAAIITNLPSLIPKIVGAVLGMIKWIIFEGVPWMTRMGFLFLASFVTSFVAEIQKSDLYKTVAGWITGLVDTVRTAWSVVTGVFAMVWLNVQQAFQTAVARIAAVMTTAWNWITSLIREIWLGIVDWFSEKWTSFTTAWKNFWSEVGRNVALAWALIKLWVTTRWNEIVAWFTEKWAAFTAWVSRVWEGIKRTVSEAWAKITKPIQDTWNAVSKWLSDQWTTLAKTATTLWDKVVGAVKTAWEKVKSVAAKPIEWVVNTVVGGWIKDGYNWLAKLVGLPEWKNFPYVKFASGGVMPGYTPGRDVHQFYSPTGGGLALSGGEAIMRPEWTRMVGGPGSVRQMNEAAKRGKLIPFADGGVFQWLAGVGSTIASWGKSAWDVVSNPLKQLLALKDKVFDQWGRSAWVQGAAGVIGKLASGVAEKVKSIFGGLGAVGGKAPAGRVYIDGKALDPDTARRWNLAEQIAKAQAFIIQGSWSNNPLSMGTHTGAGALDAVAGNWSEWVYALKKVGFMAAFRNWAGNQHIHALNPAVYGSMSYAAQAQVNRVRSGGSLDKGGWLPKGLSLVRNDTGERELVTPMALLRASEKGQLGLAKAMAAGARGLLGTAGPPASNIHDEVNIVTYIYNPVAEPASDSVQRRLTRTAQLGLIGGRRSGTEG